MTDYEKRLRKFSLENLVVVEDALKAAYHHTAEQLQQPTDFNPDEEYIDGMNWHECLRLVRSLIVEFRERSSKL